MGAVPKAKFLPAIALEETGDRISPYGNPLRVIQFPWCEDDRAVQQIKRNAEWLDRLLKDFLPEGLRVRPVLVLPGWYVKSLGKYPVSAMNAKYLTLMLASEPGRFTLSQLAPALSRLDQLCRDVEF